MSLVIGFLDYEVSNASDEQIKRYFPDWNGERIRKEGIVFIRIPVPQEDICDC